MASNHPVILGFALPHCRVSIEHYMATIIIIKRISYLYKYVIYFHMNTCILETIMTKHHLQCISGDNRMSVIDFVALQNSDSPSGCET